jgi:hypothetical protein
LVNAVPVGTTHLNLFPPCGDYVQEGAFSHPPQQAGEAPMLRVFKFRRHARIAAAGAVLMVAGLGASPAHAYCHGSIIAGGNKSAVLKHNAQKKARASWNGKSQALMGTSRAHWGNAINRSYYCHHSFVWHCTAFARPCS